MTCPPQNPDPHQEATTYQVGNYRLHATRSCEQARDHFGLSQRELETVMHVGGGLTKQDMAKRMGVSLATADTFRRRAYAKLGVHSGSAASSIITAFLAGTLVEERGYEDVD